MSWMLSCIGCGTKNLPDKEEIKILDFQHYSLHSVPAYVFECERFLEELYLDFNQISELPKELFHCHELQILSLSDNDLRKLPEAVSSLANLSNLDLSKNGISDIPESIKGCKRLAAVNASTNPLCKLPEGFTQLIALKELCLSDTFLEYLPANFGRLAGLEVLELRENQLNTLPRSMTRLVALKRLDLGQNEFTELPEVVGHLTSLTDLWFDNNRIKRLPPEIGNLSQLSFIDASNNRLVELEPNIGKCSNLSHLFLSQNEIESLPEEFCKCTKMVTLHVDENRLDRLPERLGAMERLVELKASHNELSDLPNSVGLLRSLQFLHVDDNILTHFPPDLGSCARLVVLTAAHNEIEIVPPEMGNLSSLRVINFCKNLIKYLPVSFSKLHLTALWLSANQTKPLVPLQCTNEEGQKVLTCYMLPQFYQRTPSPIRIEDRPLTEAELEARRARRLIHFAADGEKDLAPGRLSRVPTPYPKELRALAKHSRNLKAMKKEPKREEKKEQQQGLVLSQIKVATTTNSVSVAKTMNSTGNQSSPSQSPSKQLPPKEIPMENCSSQATARDNHVSTPPLPSPTTHTPSSMSSLIGRNEPPIASSIGINELPSPPKAPSPDEDVFPLILSTTSSSFARNEPTSSVVPPISPPPLLVEANFTPIQSPPSTVPTNFPLPPASPLRNGTFSTQAPPNSPTNVVSDFAIKYSELNQLSTKLHHQGGRPASIAAANLSSVSARPGSLALESTASPLWSHQRPGSLAAPINTVGIPAALQKGRAASQGALHDLSLRPFHGGPNSPIAEASHRDSFEDFNSIAKEAQRLETSFANVTPQQSPEKVPQQEHVFPLQTAVVSPVIQTKPKSSIPTFGKGTSVPSVARKEVLSPPRDTPSKIASPPSAIPSNYSKIVSPPSSIPSNYSKIASPPSAINSNYSKIASPPSAIATNYSKMVSPTTVSPSNYSKQISSEGPLTRTPSGSRIPSSRIPVSPVEKPINQTGIPVISPANKKPDTRIPTFANSSLRKKSGESGSNLQNYRVSPSGRETNKNAWTDQS